MRRRRELDAADEVSEEEQVADHAAVQVAHEHVRESLAVLTHDKNNARTLVLLVQYTVHL